MIKLSSKLTFGTEAVDWQERINMSRMREERAQRARQVMRKHGMAVMLVTGGPNCRYLTGVRDAQNRPMLGYVLFFVEHDPVVWAHAGWYHQLQDQEPWIKHWRIGRCWLQGGPGPEAAAEEAKLFASEIHQELKERGLTGEKLGIVAFDNLAKEALSELGIKVVDAWPIMLEATAIKTVDEINCFKTVAAICEAGWYKAWETLRPGIRDIDLSNIVIQTLFQAGAEEVPSGVCFYSGPLTFDRGFDRGGRLIQTGDLLYAPMCGVTYLGYRSCTYRTLIAGRKANAKEKDWYKILLDRLDAVIGEIKPGATTADAAKHFPPASYWGYRDEAELLTMEIGHGLGIFSYGPPIINRQWSLKHPQVFEPGMVMGVESREGEFRVGGVRLENMVVVTKDGAEIIDHMPREHILEPEVSRCWAIGHTK
jgi:Xaa-Pro aminopeptidase